MQNSSHNKDKSTTQKPKVTVLMAVYNGEHYLQTAINSVLNQSYQDYEFIIINDGSTDSSVEIINSNDDPRIKLIHNETNLGLIGSLNKGIENARGKYIARTDCDDLLEPDRLSKQVEVMEKNEDIVLLGSWMQLIDEHGQNLHIWHYPASDTEIRWASLFNTAIGHPSSIFRTDAARQNYGYSKDYIYAEDYDLWSRLSEVGQLANIPEALQKYRIHGGSVSTRNDARQSENRLAISKRSIKSIIANRIDDSVIEIMTFYKSPSSRADLLNSIDGFELLYQDFISQTPASPEILSKIRQDIVVRLSNLFHHLNWSDRLICLLSRLHTFPLLFWIKGRFMSFLLSEKVKRQIGRLIGKKAYNALRS